MHLQTPIFEFVIQCDRALTCRRNAEENKDMVVSTNTKPTLLLSYFPIEEDASKHYTLATFNLFQEEQ